MEHFIGIRRLLGGLALAWILVGGTACYLFESYSVDGRTTGDRDSGPTDFDTADAAVGGPDTTDADAADGADGRPATADGDVQEVSQEPCPDESGVYCLQRATPSSVTIDGACSAQEFGQGDETRMPIKSPGSDQPPGRNPTDNLIDCRARWIPGDPAQIHFCCDVQDDDPFYTAEFGDPLGKIWGDDNWEPDDRFEFARRADDTPQKAGARKIFLNIREGTPVHYDTEWRANADDTQETLTEFEGQSDWIDGGYVIEWKMPVGFPFEPGDSGICNFMHQDIDMVNGSPQREGTATLWGGDGAINKPDQWQTCFYQ